ALTSPASAAARRLAASLSAGAAIDPILAAAAALIQQAAGSPLDASARGALLARDPGDPVLAWTARRLADQAGDRDGARRASDALRAFGAGGDLSDDEAR
ncbi:MAG: hypothetical protein M3O50_01540, partial [Myxococcota bacterium]|nr:hypothetical protein [Myxococcota bacterium]